MRDRLDDLERRLEAAKARQQAAAQRAIETHTAEDYRAALETAQEVDRLWQEYAALWRRLNEPEQPPTA